MSKWLALARAMPNVPKSPKCPSATDFGDFGTNGIDECFPDARAYAEAFARLERERPDGASVARWRLAIQDARRFLTVWSGEAQRHGWSEADLFGLHPIAPMARCDVMGLVWLLNGSTVAALDGEGARLRTPSGETLSWRRQAGR